VFADQHHSSKLLTQTDIDYIRSSGRDPAQVIDQVAILLGPRVPAPILRPAVINDGIQLVRDYDLALLSRLHDQAAAKGRLSSFVPASGSGTRLFQSLFDLYRERVTDPDQVRARARDDASARDALVVLDQINDFAIWKGLEQRGCSNDSFERLLHLLFDESGLRYHELPKGLVPFHNYPDGIRTAFIEQIYEAAALTMDAGKNCRIHFTITLAHGPRFQEELHRELPRLEQTLGGRLHVGFSGQSPATDAIAVDLQGKIIRDTAGQILFRPGGHGALLENLGACGGDVVLIKNIDNVARQEHLQKIVEIRKQISGLLLFVEAQIHETIRGLRQRADPTEALRLLDRLWGRKPQQPLSSADDQRAWALTQLNRPLRVCAVVATLEHAGGRPFWMTVDQLGAALQIVEGAEIDLGDQRQRDLFHSSRHFNPVDIACSLRDVDGRPFDLKLFSDPSRALIANKTLWGVPAVIYEHPGLWNGGMALWNTVFLEVPDFTFNPVKSLSDLWAPGHRQAP